MEDSNSVIEWTIENFSCWNCDIHGNKLSLPQIDFSSSAKEERFLKLFPKGASGKEEYLVVKIYNPWSSGDCELSYIGSDGSVIQTESMSVKREYSKVFIGPMYEDVVNRIRENEPLHKDILTLRVRTNFRVVSFNRHAVTVLEVFKTSLKLNSSIFKDREINIGLWDRISSIQYPVDGNGDKNLYIYAKVGCREDIKMEGDQKIIVGQKTTKSREDLDVKLMLRSCGESTEKVLAQIAFSLHYDDEAILKDDFEEHVFAGRDEWIFPKSITVRELMVNTHYILFNLKIVAVNTPKTYSHWSRYPEETEISLSNIETTAGECSSPSAHNASDTSMDSLTKELMHLFQDQEFSDLKIRCGEVTFPVHRGILSARSPVFKRLLSSDKKETAPSLLVIEDLDPSTLSGFLGFLYSGTVENLQWDSALKIYHAADMYQVPSLKRECASVLSAEISVSNVCEVLSLADKHPDDQLTCAAHDFMLKNYNRVLKSKEWKEFMALDPKLLLKTVTLFAENDYVGKMNEPLL